MRDIGVMLAVSILIVAMVGWSAENRPIGTETTVSINPVTFGLFSGSPDLSNTINASFSPDGNIVYFSKSQPGWSGLTIFVSHYRNHQWSEPQVASFSGVYRDTDPAVTPDGHALIFASIRTAASTEAPNYKLYRVSLIGSDTKTVEALPETINLSAANNLYPSIASDGTLYFIRLEGRVARIYRSEWSDGMYQAPELVRLPGDTGSVADSDPTISPDQSFVVFSSNRPDSLGSTDLYIAFRRGEGWCTPHHLEAPINSTSSELATGLSRDGRTLYFASTRSSVVQPRAERADALHFRSELSKYQNGTLKTYRADISAWLRSHAPAEKCD